MKTAYISHPDFYLHDMGQMHPESPNRLYVIDAALKKSDLSRKLVKYEAKSAERDQLLLVHDEKYLQFLDSTAPKSGIVNVNMDTAMNSHTLSAAYRAAGALVMAVDLVMSKQAQMAFCAVRPPGHHAEKNEAMGFCFFNNVAVGAAYLMQKYKLSRILIVDFDVHHGNGTEYMFENDARVLICSSFQHPQYPGKPFVNNSDHIINIPLATATESREFRQKVEELWFLRIEAFKPEFIFISAGFDAHCKDPLGGLELVEDDYKWLTQKLVDYAKLFADGRMISTLEGGYDPDSLAACVLGHLEVMVNS